VYEYLGNMINNKKSIEMEYAGMLNWSSDVPEGSKEVFESMLEKFKNKKCKILEVGTYVGTSVINMLKYLPDATATVIDMWINYYEHNLLGSIEENNIEEIFYNNLKKVDIKHRVRVLEGDSKNILVDMVKKREKYDFIYVDGSHKCLDCYNDMVLSWRLLSNNGILAKDDYLWKPENIKNEYLDRPYYAVEHFIEKYKDELEILHKGYRVFLMKRKIVVI